MSKVAEKIFLINSSEEIKSSEEIRGPVILKVRGGWRGFWAIIGTNGAWCKSVRMYNLHAGKRVA
jgi:hypothetical protein